MAPTICPTTRRSGSSGPPTSVSGHAARSGGRRRAWPRRWVYLGWDRLAAAYYRKRGELGRIGWLWSIRPPVQGAVFALDDLGPLEEALELPIRELLLDLGEQLTLRRLCARQ